MTLKQIRKAYNAALRQLFKTLAVKETAKTDSPAPAKGLGGVDCDRYLTLKKRDGTPLMVEN